MSALDPPSVSQPGEQRFHFLDGVRGWGSVVVLLSHTYATFPFSERSLALVGRMFFMNGFLAVSIFFLISGFALSINYLRTGNLRILRVLFLSRYLRFTIPILTISLLVYLLFKIGAIVPAGERPPEVRGFPLSAPTLGQVLKFSFHGVYFDYKISETLDPPPLDDALGNRGVSADFLGSNLGGKRAAAELGVCHPSAGIAGLGPDLRDVFGRTDPGDIFCRCAGKAGSSGMVKLGWAALPAGMLLSILLPGGSLQLYLAVTLLLGMSTIFTPRIRGLFCSKLSQYLGRISYALYLTHPLIFFAYTARLYPVYASTAITWGLVTLSSLIFALIVAHLFARIDEAGRRLPNGPPCSCWVNPRTYGPGAWLMGLRRT